MKCLESVLIYIGERSATDILLEVLNNQIEKEKQCESTKWIQEKIFLELIQEVKDSLTEFLNLQTEHAFFGYT